MSNPEVLKELWSNWYLKYTLYEAPCLSCDGCLVVHFQNNEVARFCNYDLREMLPAIQEFVAGKNAEEERS